ncbi:MAG TPA: class I SAM-dependent RNA methyltransferase, partial [Bdellovibrionota bacterium]|nr:class I SAM-dependent RNA methyltransferase [Bdellovibrionota bacterium]
LKAKRGSLEPDLEWTREALAAHLDGLHLNWHPSTGRQVFSPDWQRVWGLDRARRADGAWYGPDSFGQLRTDLHARSLARAARHLSPVPGDAVVDLYSGIGLSLERWKSAGADFLGVELGAEAIACTALNLGEDGRVLRGRCSDRLPQIREWSRRPRSGRVVVYANPPRTGLEPEVVAWLASPDCEASMMAYLSCSPGTLARDLRELGAAGWARAGFEAYDFFPGTHLVETLALLTRRG